MSGEAWARVMYASHHCGAHCMETMLASWAGTAGPPFSSHPEPEEPAPTWDFRKMEV